MLNIIKYEGKDEEEIFNKITTELECEKKDLLFKTEFTEGKLFKSSKCIISVIKKDEVKKAIEKFVKNVGNLMNIIIDSEILEIDGTFNVTLISDNNSILIGRDGKTLNAMQTLIRQSIKNYAGIIIKINLDISNYKIKKMQNIELLVRNIAKEVKETNISVSLDSMNSYERRLVHTIVDEFEGLETESIGEGKDRHVVIKCKEEK